MADLGFEFLRLFFNELKRADLRKFAQEHDELYKAAKLSGDHAEVTRHYYELMAPILDRYYGGSLHFCAPAYPRQPRDEAMRHLHERLARMLQLTPESSVLDVGCGVGGCMLDVARATGARVHGVTISAEEVRLGNEAFARAGVGERCAVQLGDCTERLPFDAGSLDAVYAVYSMKYFSDLEGVFSQIGRVLKPGGLFLIYDLVVTDAFDTAGEQDRKIIEALEYACGMPSLHSNLQMIDTARRVGLECVSRRQPFSTDLSTTELAWHHYLSSSRLFVWLVRSSTAQRLTTMAERLGALPTGFGAFNRVFLAGTVDKLLAGAERGVLSGSSVLLLRRV